MNRNKLLCYTEKKIIKLREEEVEKEANIANQFDKAAIILIAIMLI